MSEIRVNNITNREGSAGPSVAGIPVVDSNSHFVVPTGRTGQRYADGGENIVRDGLVLYLDAKYSYPGASGTNPDTYTWYDLSGNENHGELKNGVSYSGTDGGSLVFDGSNDFVRVFYNSSINPSNSISFSQWVMRTQDDSSIRNSLEARDNSNELYFILFRGDTTPKRWQFGVRQSNGFYKEPYIQDLFLDVNVWYNLCFVANSEDKSLKIYVNGENQQPYDNINTYTGSLKISDTTNPALYIGSDPPFSRYFLGKISQTLIYNRALTAQEVLQNFDATRSRYGI